MKTIRITILLIIFASGHFSCSKSGDDSPTGYFPTTIHMENTNGESAHYEIEYTASNTIDNIIFQRAISGIPTSFLSEFGYDTQQHLVYINTEDVSNGIHRDMEFKYDNDGNLVDVRYVVNLTDTEVNLSHDSEVNSYSLSNEDYGFTLVLSPDDVLKRVQFPSSELTITSSDNEKGVFQYLQNRIPLQIWLVMLFQSNQNLFFFQNKGISNVLIDENHFAYVDKSWDMNGNLLTYRVTNGPLSSKNYNVHYETRNLK